MKKKEIEKNNQSNSRKSMNIQKSTIDFKTKSGKVLRVNTIKTSPPKQKEVKTINSSSHRKKKK